MLKEKTYHNYKIFAVLFSLLLSTMLYGQSERKLVREGNKLYKEKKFTDAEVSYKKSLNANKESKTAQFNLGDAYFKQDKYEEAASQFQSVATDKKISKEEQAQAYHNLGTSLLKSKKYEESINSFKNALKINPKDNDTRYNLAYAQAMLQQQQQQQKQQQQDNKEQNKDDKKQQQQQQQKEDKKDHQQKEEQKQAQQQKPKVSKEDAEKMLSALNNDEKNAQKKLAAKPRTRIQIEKQW